MTVKITGLDAVKLSITDAIDDIGLQSELMISLILQGISANTMPYVPVDTSFLINSETRMTEKTATGARGEIAFAAEYAAAVHNGPQKNWQKPGASNKFLEIGANNFVQDDLASVIARFQP